MSIDLTDGILRAVADLFGKNLCALAWVIENVTDHGTGNLIQIDGVFYIATCKHIADAFFEQEITQVQFYTGQQFSKSDLIYLGSTDDSLDLDLAVIGFKQDQQFKHFYDAEDLLDVIHFGEFPFNDYGLVVCGFPVDLSSRRHQRVELVPMAYLTEPLESKPSDASFLYCDFPFKAGEIDSTSSTSEIPRPMGMSGGAVLMIPKLPPPGALWSLSGTKMIAIQSAWDKETYLKAVSIRHIHAMVSIIQSRMII